MGKANKKPHLEITRESLRLFEPISSLSNERLDELASLADVELINMGVSLFREGDVDNQTIYVLKGDVQLISSSAKNEITVHSNSEESRFPLDDSQPRQYSAVAMSLVEIIRIDNSVLDYMMMWDQLAVSEISSKESSSNSNKSNKNGNTKDDTIEKPDEDTTEKLIKQAVLDSLEKAREQDDGSISATDGKADFTKTIKPELNAKKIQNKNNTNKAKKQESQEPDAGLKNNTTKKKNAENSNAQTTVNEAIKTVTKKTEDNKLRDNQSGDQKKTKNSPKEENPIVHESRDWIRKIRQIMAFKNMPPANIKNLLEKMQSVNVKKGDKIIEQGGDGDYYYIITDGTAVVTRTVELATLSPGTSFGEEALVAQSPRNASVSMTSDGILMRLSKKDFDELLIEPLMAKVSPDEARSKVLQGAKWLDVRHAKEFHHSRLPGAINIPLHELRLRMTELDKGTEYICCCRTGARSSSGSFLLAQNGFKVSLLTGGIQVMSQDLRR